jgi:hypothetical protein
VLDTIRNRETSGHLLWSPRRPPQSVLPRSRSYCSRRRPSRASGSRTHSRKDKPVYNPHSSTTTERAGPHDNYTRSIARGTRALRSEGRGAFACFEGLHAAMASFRDHRLPELPFAGFTRDWRRPAVSAIPVACSPQAWASSDARPPPPPPFLPLADDPRDRARRPWREDSIIPQSAPSSVPTAGRAEAHASGPPYVSMRFRRVAERCHIEALEIDGPPSGR